MLHEMSKIRTPVSATRCALSALAAAAGVLTLASVLSAQPAANPAPQKTHHSHKPRAGQLTASQPAVDQAPPQPEAPKWPANQAPSQPHVTWNSQGLHIEASNASLSQILNQVSTETGAKIEGANGDERVFGDYGPGPARDVLTQLLRGSNYDFLMLGDQGQGTPRQVILATRKGGAAEPAQNPVAPQEPQELQPDDETVEQPDQPEQPEEQAPPPQPMPAQPPPSGDQMTPQQRMELMQQQRLQQMQQLQQQYQQQQQQQQQPPQ